MGAGVCVTRERLRSEGHGKNVLLAKIDTCRLFGNKNCGLEQEICLSISSSWLYFMDQENKFQNYDD